MERLPLSRLARGIHCFVCGPDHETGLRLRFEWVGDGAEATLRAQPNIEGWPGLVQGGALAALHDEAAAWAMFGVQGKVGVTMRMDVTYHRPVRLGDRITIRGRLEKDEGFWGSYRTELIGPSGVVSSRGTVNYRYLSLSELEGFLSRPIDPVVHGWVGKGEAERREIARGWAWPE